MPRNRGHSTQEPGDALLLVAQCGSAVLSPPPQRRSYRYSLASGPLRGARTEPTEAELQRRRSRVRRFVATTASRSLLLPPFGKMPSWRRDSAAS